MENNNLVIEFIGMPGSGKSTLCDQVYNDLKNEYDIINFTSEITKKNKSSRIIIKLYYFFTFFLMHPSLFIKLLTKIYRTEQKTLRDFVKVSFNLYFILGVLEKKDNIIILFDQGILQAFWSIYFNSKRNKNIDIVKLLKYYFPDLVVEVSVRKEILKNRLLTRNGNSRFENKKFDFNLNYLKSSNYFKEIINYINKYNLKYLNIDNNTKSDLNDNIESINKFILNMMKKQEGNYEK
jgi:adenylate kinase family enzyme